MKCCKAFDALEKHTIEYSCLRTIITDTTLVILQVATTWDLGGVKVGQSILQKARVGLPSIGI